MRISKQTIPSAIIFMFLTRLSLAQSPLFSNEQLVISTVKEACQKEFAETRQGRVVVLAPGTGVDELIASALAEAMRQKYAEVVLGSQPDSLSHNLQFDVQGFDFAYKKGSSRGFLKARNVKRELRCKIRITIKDGRSGVISDMKELDISYSDQIDPSLVKLVNSDEIAALAPNAPGSSWSKIIEPALVTISVGTLVYLFFANR